MTVNFIESNPIPVKSAMAAMGLLEEHYRLPMVPPRDASRRRIREVLSALDASRVDAAPLIPAPATA
jgi:4-hydroxy-tetrahydrodipicolinate synthase